MVITELNIGGAEKAFARVAIGLKARGWDVDVVSLRDAGLMALDLRQAGIEVAALNCRGVLDLRAIWRLRSHLKRITPSIVLSFLHQANLVSRLAARLAGIRRTVSGIRVADRRWVVTFPDRLTSGLVRTYVAVSQTVAKVHAECCQLAEHPVVIPNGVDIEAITAASGADRSVMCCDANDVVILSVGRLSAQKAPLVALTGFQRLLSQTPPDLAKRLRLVFVGDGPMRATLQQEVSHRRLVAHVRLLGWRADVWSLMKASDVLLLASSWEGLPNVIMEAQATRLAVVASNIDGNAELIQHGQTGRLFEVGNTNEMTQQLLDAVTHTDQTRTMTNAAFQFIQSWTWDEAIQKYDQLLLSVVET
jgi:glycosyltransferase involved in cell wall biosynthesis